MAEARQPLQGTDLHNLAELLRQLFGHIGDLKKNAGARYIQFPKLPSMFSESLVLRCSKTLFPVGENFRLGGRVCDVAFDLASETKRVEVKGTGRSSFQYFGPKDIAADYLVWLDFGDYFHHKQDKPIRVFLLRGPGQLFSSPRKITLKTFERICADKLSRYEASLSNAIDGHLSLSANPHNFRCFDQSKG